MLNENEKKTTGEAFWLRQLGQVPLYGLLIYALHQTHNENKAIQDKLVLVLETTLRDNSEAMKSVKAGIEMAAKSQEQLSRELELHRQVMREKMAFDKIR